MGNKKSFKESLADGRVSQEFVVRYFEKTLGMKFVGGDRLETVLNQKEIERVNKCDYIPPCALGYDHGPMLGFKDSYGFDTFFTMPDEFFLNTRKNTHMWVEVKGTDWEQKADLHIPIGNFKSYLKVKEITRFNVYVAFCMPMFGDEIDGEFYDIYYEEVYALKDTWKKSWISNNYYWNVIECFRKLNRNPIQYNQYF